MNLALIQQVLREKCGLQPEKALVVGVSGGADSLCLLDVLHRLGYSVVAAHFNHQLRPAAAADADFVAEFAAKMGVPFVLVTENVRQMAQTQGLSIEEAARSARYHFLFAQARQLAAQAVAVGHHAGDQVETVLMHFLRGSGLAGLRGMQVCAVLKEWDGSIPLVRPLLSVSKAEILAYCSDRGIQPREDETNADVTYYRNRLRHELIPNLAIYNPQFAGNLLHTAEVLAGDETLLEELTNTSWQYCCDTAAPGVLRLDPPRFIVLKRPLQRRLLRRAAGLLLPELRDVDFEAVERGLDFCASNPVQGKVDLAGGLFIEADTDGLFFHAAGNPLPLGDFPQVGTSKDLTLEVPGVVELSGGWAILADEAAPPEDFTGQPIDTAWLNPKGLTGALTVRRALPGESFKPLGYDGKPVRLTNFWTNQHIPRRARAGWPVVVDRGEIIWVVGERISEQVKLKSHRQKAIRLRLVRRPTGATSG